MTRSGSGFRGGFPPAGVEYLLRMGIWGGFTGWDYGDWNSGSTLFVKRATDYGKTLGCTWWNV